MLHSSDALHIFKQAYQETKSETESEPNLDYWNGGITKISNDGQARFKLALPAGYEGPDGIIPAHFHYRICLGNKMSQVSINQPAPDFSLNRFTGEQFRLSDLQGHKNVLLVFNRGFT